MTLEERIEFGSCEAMIVLVGRAEREQDGLAWRKGAARATTKGDEGGNSLTPAWLHVPVDRSLRYAYKIAHKFGSTG